jgi:hypothetical protein
VADPQLPGGERGLRIIWPITSLDKIPAAHLNRVLQITGRRNTDLKKITKLAKEQDGFGRSLSLMRLTFGTCASVKGQSALFADCHWPCRQQYNESPRNPIAWMVELVDTRDLKSRAPRERASSILALGTTL